MTREQGILVVDDERSALRACNLALLAGGLGPVTLCENPREALPLAREQSFRLVLLDLAMPGMSGEELLEQFRQEQPWLPVIIVTAFNDAVTAMRCIRAGASDYLTKPLDKDRLLTTVRRALDTSALEHENARLKAHLLGQREIDASAFGAILTQDTNMLAIFRYANAIADGAEPVLITGETGTGKELMAKAIHDASGRRGKFVALNLSGLDEQMFSDTLFGHAKGAYTGAIDSRAGLLQKAANGTIFLDEIGDVDLPLQSRLLRMIENGEYYAGGSDKLLRSDARVVAATNRDIHALCDSGEMRRDLYYRLNVHHIHLPPLRERNGDIGLLADAFAKAAAAKRGRAVPVFPPPVMDMLMRHEWPGNIRELQSVITDAVAGAGDTIPPTRLRARLRMRKKDGQTASEPAAATGFPTIRKMTEELVHRAIRQADGNQSKAAQLLGISQPALSKRLKIMGEGG